MSDQKPNEQHYQIEANKTEMVAMQEQSFPKEKGLYMTEIAFQIGRQVQAGRMYQRKRRAVPSAN